MKYRMDDGTIVDTKFATARWDEGRQWNGNNSISLATGSQWDHETLYRSRRGRYWIESWSAWQGTTSRACYVTTEEAAAWVAVNVKDKEVPDDLRKAVDAISE